mmetsp:Transcript_18414/g.56267  ORF Transcript_18414/g.56267 Transcript_18414/m.56267 type:complete len:216 (+) Transcript_18414:40-687(+)
MTGAASRFFALHRCKQRSIGANSGHVQQQTPGALNRPSILRPTMLGDLTGHQGGGQPSPLGHTRSGSKTQAVSEEKRQGISRARIAFGQQSSALRVRVSGKSERGVRFRVRVQVHGASAAGYPPGRWEQLQPPQIPQVAGQHTSPHGLTRPSTQRSLGPRQSLISETPPVPRISMNSLSTPTASTAIVLRKPSGISGYTTSVVVPPDWKAMMSPS